jgi:hypothetical protein
MISDQYNKMVDVQRVIDDSGNTEVYDDHITDLPCVIQPFDDAYSQDIDGSFGKEWLMFCDVNDILEGDRIVDGAVEYKVVSVESFEFLNKPQHMELRIRRENK